MTYEITWKGGAARDMDALPLGTASVVVEFVYGPLAENPHLVGKPLRFELRGLHSARRGNYRVIYEILEAQVVVQIVTVRHRADAYRSGAGDEGPRHHGRQPAMTRSGG